MSKSETATVRVNRRFAASAERVFDAWLDPNRLGQWLFSTETGEMVTVEVDARVGGTFNITERRGGIDVAHVGTYLEIDRPRRLVFEVSVAEYGQTAERVSIDIIPLEEGCELRLTHEMAVRANVTPDMIQVGWSMILEHLTAVLQGMDPVATPTSDWPVAQVTRTINAEPARVFDAWLDPSLLGKWMFGPAVREEEILHLKVNPMVGGSFSFLVRRGEDEIDHVGEYLVIDHPRRLVFTWGVRETEGTDFSRVEVEIESSEGGSTLTVRHAMAPAWKDFTNRAQNAWALMTEALAKIFA